MSGLAKRQAFRISKARFNKNGLLFNSICCNYKEFEFVLGKATNACVYCRTPAYDELTSEEKITIDKYIQDKINYYRELYQAHLDQL